MDSFECRLPAVPSTHLNSAMEIIGEEENVSAAANAANFEGRVLVPRRDRQADGRAVIVPTRSSRSSSSSSSSSWFFSDAFAAAPPDFRIFLAVFCGFVAAAERAEGRLQCPPV